MFSKSFFTLKINKKVFANKSATLFILTIAIILKKYRLISIFKLRALI